MPTDWQALITGGAKKLVIGNNRVKTEEVAGAEVQSATAEVVSPKQPVKRASKLPSFTLDGINFEEPPNRCWRGQFDSPKLMVITDSPSVYEFRYDFAHCGDAGMELNRTLVESGLDCGNFESAFTGVVNFLKQEEASYNEDYRQFIINDLQPGDVLFYHLNIGNCVEEVGGRMKLREMTDEDAFKSLAFLHNLLSVVNPKHLLVLGSEAFTRITGKTNVSVFAGVNLDYTFPAFLKQCIEEGNRDLRLLKLSTAPLNIPMDVDAHPAYVLQQSHNRNQLSTWKTRIKSMCGRLGEKVEVYRPEHVVFTDFEQACTFLDSWINDPALDILSYDFETLSLAACAFKESIIVTTNFARDTKCGYAVPVWHKDCTWTREQRLIISTKIGQLLMKPRKVSHTHNGLFDNLVARSDPYLGIGCKQIPGQRIDTMILAYCVDETGPQGLKELCNIYTQLKNYEAELDEWKKNNKWKNYGDIPLLLLGKYGAYDAVANILLAESLSSGLKADKRGNMWEIASELMPVQAQGLENVPFYGQCIDRDMVMEISKHHQDLIAKAIADLLATPDMKEFIENRILERAAEFAQDQLTKPLNCTKVWKTVHPADANRTDLRKIFTQVRDDVQNPASGYRIHEDGSITKPDGTPHPHSVMAEEVYLVFAQRQQAADTSDDPKLRYVPNFNTNGSGEMGRFFYEQLKLNVEYRTDTGAPSLDEEAMNRIAEQHTSAIPFKSYKDMTKEYGTYVRPLEEAFRCISNNLPTEYMSSDGFTHYEIYLGKTVTGRTSAQYLQLLPRSSKIKHFFKTRFKNGFIVQADLSQIELRVFAAVGRVRTMIEAYLAGEDLHHITASKIFRDAYLLCTDKKRKKNFRTGAKRCNFGTIFGTGAGGLVSTIKKEGVEVLELGGLNVQEIYAKVFRKMRIDPVANPNYDRGKVEKEVDHYRIEIAQNILDQFFLAHPDAKVWIDEVHEFTTKNGYYYSPFGRIRRLPAALGNDEYLRAEAMRQAQNAPIQATASDITLVAYAAIQSEVFERGMRSVPIGSVHDSLVMDSPSEEAVEMSAIMRKYMNDPRESFKRMGLSHFDLDWLTVPIDSDGEVGPSLGDSFPIKDGQMKVLDKESGDPDTLWIPVESFYEWKASQPSKAA